MHDRIPGTGGSGRKRGAALLLALWTVALVSQVGFAEPRTDSTTAVAPEAAAPILEAALLRVGNRDIITFRTSMLGYDPSQRVGAASHRITEALRARARGVRSVAVELEPSEFGTLVKIDNVWMFSVLPGDVNPLTGETLTELAERARLNLEQATTAVLEQRTVSRVLRSVLFTLIATVIYWLLLRWLIRLVRWGSRRVAEGLHGLVNRAGLASTLLLAQIGGPVRLLLRLAGVVIAIVLTDLWATYILKLFPYTYPWGDQIDDHLIAAGASVGSAILHAVPKLLMLALILVVSLYVRRWVNAVFEAVREGRIEMIGLDRDTAVPAQRLAILFVWLVTLAVAYPYIPGSDTTAFKGLSVLFGLMLSLGSSNVVSQAASGYMLTFSKALRVGDYVRIDDYEGTVMSIGTLSTKLRTPRDEEINIPNTVIVSTTTRNYTRLNREKGAPIATTVTIGYSSPWRQVHAMLLEAARRTPGLRTSPEPRVLQTALSDFYVEYTPVSRLEEREARVRTLSVLHANIQDIFNEYGVQIMSPHYEGDPEGKVWVPREKWHEAPAREQANDPESPPHPVPSGE